VMTHQLCDRGRGRGMIQYPETPSPESEAIGF
jgi:hypothetical protein